MNVTDDMYTDSLGILLFCLTGAPIMIKSFLNDLWRSERHAVITGGVAAFRGSVLTAHISIGKNTSHLLFVSVMSAPATLASYAKVVYLNAELIPVILL